MSEDSYLRGGGPPEWAEVVRSILENLSSNVIWALGAYGVGYLRGQGGNRQTNPPIDVEGALRAARDRILLSNSNLRMRDLLDTYELWMTEDNAAHVIHRLPGEKWIHVVVVSGSGGLVAKIVARGLTVVASLMRCPTCSASRKFIGPPPATTCTGTLEMPHAATPMVAETPNVDDREPA